MPQTVSEPRDRPSSEGFTLIELLIVTVIMAILAAISYPVFLSFVNKAHYAEAKQQMGVIARELQGIYLENQRYPIDVAPNIRPSSVTTWPQTIPFNSTLDYDHWALGNGRCYVQLAFWGDKNQRHYEYFQQQATPGSFKEIDGNLILAVSVYDCAQASAGPVH